MDGSGKATQTDLLYQALQKQDKPVRKVSFPNYESPSSSLIKMYLNGEFGSDPQSVNAFATSVFFAVDRFASFRKDWQPFYENGGIIIADRYVTSNLVHQAGKIAEAAEKERYIHWLSDLEYNIFGLPRPDCVIFLDMPPAYSLRLRQQRNALKQGTWRRIFTKPTNITCSKPIKTPPPSPNSSSGIVSVRRRRPNPQHRRDSYGNHGIDCQIFTITLIKIKKAATRHRSACSLSSLQGSYTAYFSKTPFKKAIIPASTSSLISL